MAGIRKSIGKATRFRIFARDGYTCRYCGSTPPNVVLVIDHMHPVAEGGGNDDANLITSCRDCNAGKGKKLLGTIAPTEEDGRRIAQEYAEQVDVAELAERAAKARLSMRATLTDYWTAMFGHPPRPTTVSQICNLAAEFDPETVMGWIDAVSAKGMYETNACKYMAGIARNCRPKPDEVESLTPELDKQIAQYIEFISAVSSLVSQATDSGYPLTVHDFAAAARDKRLLKYAKTIEAFHEEAVSEAIRRAMDRSVEIPEAHK